MHTNYVHTAALRAVVCFAMELTLLLLMLRISITDNHNFAMSFNNLAFVANWFYRRSNLHNKSSY